MTGCSMSNRSCVTGRRAGSELRGWRSRCLRFVRGIAELHAWSHDIPNVTDLLAVRVASLRVLGEVVERDVVVGQLHRPVISLEGGQLALNSWWQQHLGVGRNCRPICRAVTGTSTLAGFRVLGEQVDRHTFGVSQERTELRGES